MNEKKTTHWYSSAFQVAGKWRWSILRHEAVVQLGDRSSLFLSLLLKTCKVPKNAPMFYAMTTRSTILSSCLPHITGIAASPRAIFCHNAGGEQGLKAFKLGGGYHYTIFLLVILTLWFVAIWNSSGTILRFSMTDDFPHQEVAVTIKIVFESESPSLQVVRSLRQAADAFIFQMVRCDSMIQ